MFPPYGLRLEHDSACIHEVPGINVPTPDNGVEFGFEAVVTAQRFDDLDGLGHDFRADAIARQDQDLCAHVS